MPGTNNTARAHISAFELLSPLEGTGWAGFGCMLLSFLWFFKILREILISVTIFFFLFYYFGYFYISYLFIHISGIILEKGQIRSLEAEGCQCWFKGHYQSRSGFSELLLFFFLKLIASCWKMAEGPPDLVSTRHGKKRERQRLLSFPTSFNKEWKRSLESPTIQVLAHIKLFQTLAHSCLS